MTGFQSRWTTAHERWFAAALYAVVLVLLALPIFSVVVPPLGDYPNHLARMHVLAAYHASPALQANYVISWRPAPYLAMDLIVPLLVHVMPIYAAGRVFLMLCLCLFVGGTAAIHAALHRKFSPWPAAGALFAYNYVFFLGFANYLFAAGIWLLAFAGWILLPRGPALWRFLLGSLLALAVFFSHFFAFLGFIICVGAYELGLWLHGGDRSVIALLRRSVAAACPFLLPVGLFVWVPKGQDSGVTRYGDLADKITAILSPVRFPGARFDLVILAFAICVFAAGFLTGRLRLAPAMRVPLILLAGVAIIMPNLLVGVWGMDYRYPFVLALLLIAACDWQALSPRVAAAMAGAAVLLLAANMLSIRASWRPIAEQYDEFRAALPVIPRGAALIAFREDDGIDRRMVHGPLAIYLHLPALAVIERDVYLPYLFKNPMMPVASAPRFKAIDTWHGHPIPLSDLIAGADPVKGPAMLGELDDEGRRNYWGGWPRHYDYAVELAFGAKAKLPPQLQLMKSGPMFNIYRIQH